ncbi:hypothetical protein D3C87_1761580 [compost metagenome]
MKDNRITKAGWRINLCKEMNFITGLSVKVLIPIAPENPRRIFVGQDIMAVCSFNVVIDAHVLNGKRNGRNPTHKVEQNK